MLGQLRAAVHVLRFPIDIPGRGWSVTRQYGACCKAVAHAVRLPLRAMENRRMFWPGFNELAPARVCFLGCRSIDQPVMMLHRVLNLPLNITPFETVAMHHVVLMILETTAFGERPRLA